MQQKQQHTLHSVLLWLQQLFSALMKGMAGFDVAISLRSMVNSFGTHVARRAQSRRGGGHQGGHPKVQPCTVGAPCVCMSRRCRCRRPASPSPPVHCCWLNAVMLPLPSLSARLVATDAVAAHVLLLCDVFCVVIASRRCELVILPSLTALLTFVWPFLLHVSSRQLTDSRGAAATASLPLCVRLLHDHAVKWRVRVQGCSSSCGAGDIRWVHPHAMSVADAVVSRRHTTADVTSQTHTVSSARCWTRCWAAVQAVRRRRRGVRCPATRTS